MNFRDLQERHAPWVKTNFPNAEKWEPLVGLVEEYSELSEAYAVAQVYAQDPLRAVGASIGKISHSFLKMHQGIRGTTEQHMADISDAVGDIIIYLAHFCTMNGIDMQKAVENTWAEVSQRDWVNHKGNGKDLNPEDLTEVGSVS